MLNFNPELYFLKILFLAVGISFLVLMWRIFVTILLLKLQIFGLEYFDKKLTHTNTF